MHHRFVPCTKCSFGPFSFQPFTWPNGLRVQSVHQAPFRVSKSSSTRKSTLPVICSPDSKASAPYPVLPPTLTETSTKLSYLNYVIVVVLAAHRKQPDEATPICPYMYTQHTHVEQQHIGTTVLLCYPEKTNSSTPPRRTTLSSCMNLLLISPPHRACAGRARCFPSRVTRTMIFEQSRAKRYR